MDDPVSTDLPGGPHNVTGRRLLIAWAGLIALLGIELAASSLPIAPSMRPLLLIPAALMVSTVAVAFMEIEKAPPIARLFAAASLLWLAILLLLGCLDAMTRVDYLVSH
jgi:caa(3)-type oxidase subunit IV